jgi:hypothetical protein
MNKLNNDWSCWVHYQNDNEWTLESYKLITKFSYLKEVTLFIEKLHENIIKKTMVFFMKDNILPLWETEENIDGGCFSYKISNNNIVNIFKTLLYKIIGNTLIDNEVIMNNINGLSISPKKNFCIIKIWMKNKDSFENFDNSSNKDPFAIHKIFNIEEQICVFKQHK